MIIGKVKGKCVSTIKHESLKGSSFILVSRSNDDRALGDEEWVVLDPIGCNVGENVLISTGSSVQYALKQRIPVDMVVIGIVDDISKGEMK